MAGGAECGDAALLSRRSARAARKKRRRVPNVWDAPPSLRLVFDSLFFQHFRYNVHAFADEADVGLAAHVADAEDAPRERAVASADG